MAKRPRSKDPITAQTRALLRGETDEAYLNTLGRIQRAAMGMPQAQAPAASPRPMPRPGATERGSRFDEGMTREEMERGSSAPGVSMRPVQRPAKKFADGGMVRGCKPGQMSGKKFSGTF